MTQMELCMMCVGQDSVMYIVKLWLYATSATVDFHFRSCR